MALIAMLLGGRGADADPGPWDCIRKTPLEEVYRLRPELGLETVFRYSTWLPRASDLVVDVGLALAASNAPGSPLLLQLRINGRETGAITRRVPGALPGNLFLRGFAPDVDGAVTIEVRARNLSAKPIDFWQVWVSPLVLPGEERTLRSGRHAPLAVGEAWTETIADRLVPSGRTVFAGGHLQIAGGIPGELLEIRMRVGAAWREFSARVPEELPDGLLVGAFFRTPDAPRVRAALEVRSPGGPVTLGARSLSLQSLGDFTLLQGRSEGPVTFPDDQRRHLLARSGSAAVTPATLGAGPDRSTVGWGVGHLVLEGDGSVEVKGYPRLALPDGRALWCPDGGRAPCIPRIRPGDVGILDLPGAPDPLASSYMLGWGGPVGFEEEGSPELVFEAFGVCGSGREIVVEEASFDLVVLPFDGERPPMRCAFEPDGIVSGVAERRDCFADGRLFAPTPPRRSE